ncbi:hypothetical protein SAMN05216174_108211 [Actinokineospora iranica]|uniref:Uncharacterized protein n=1 Tax=Actinokineospora iranica TaxID=1271860 RepID=A0A1G6SXN8_9PSEU|nr:hypothetical protein SAMN05216174_108211 [Actinokineospora iranica]
MPVSAGEGGQCGHRLDDLPRLGQIEFSGPRGKDGDIREPGQLTPELPTATGYQKRESHRGQFPGSAARRLSGSHQARLSRYHWTVLARPSSKETRGW